MHFVCLYFFYDGLNSCRWNYHFLSSDCIRMTIAISKDRISGECCFFLGAISGTK